MKDGFVEGGVAVQAVEGVDFEVFLVEEEVEDVVCVERGGGFSDDGCGGGVGGIGRGFGRGRGRVKGGEGGGHTAPVSGGEV